MAMYHVQAVDNLQYALDAAQPGDVILLEAGAQFIGNFILRPKQGTPHQLPPGLPSSPQPYHIVIRSDASDAQLPRPAERVDPQQHAAYLTKMISPNHDTALQTAGPTAEATTWAYWLIGIELTVDPNVPPDPLSPDNTANYGIIALGDANQTDLQQVPSNLVFDRCYIHGNPGQNVRRGIALNSADTIITECYISDFHLQLTAPSGVPDAQAIQGHNGPGPYQIVNCYLEAGEENTIFGGEDPKIPGLVPSDIYFYGNYFSKPLEWRTGSPPGYIPGVKNLFELKSGQRVMVEGNIFEHVWMNRDQRAYAIVLGPRNQNCTANGSQSTIRDVTFRNNIIRHAGQGIQLFGIDDQITNDPSCVTQPEQNIVFQNNLFYDIDGTTWGGDGVAVEGRFLLIEAGGGASDYTFDHNTCFQTGEFVIATFENLPPPLLEEIDNFTFTNNLAATTGRLAGDGQADGQAALNFYFNNPMVPGNILPSVNSATYPPNNFYPATPTDVDLVEQDGGSCPPEGGFCGLAATSPYKGQGTDGNDPGCDIAVIMDKTTVAATGHREGVSVMKMGAGSTPTGQTSWQDYSVNGTRYGIYVDVDTSAAGFSSTPIYVSVIGGDGWQWQTTGGSAIYTPTATGFRVYVRWSSNDAGPNPPNPPDPQFANDNGWYINWIGWGL
jgi:hypothetical protein